MRWPKLDPDEQRRAREMAQSFSDMLRKANERSGSVIPQAEYDILTDKEEAIITKQMRVAKFIRLRDAREASGSPQEEVGK